MRFEIQRELLGCVDEILFENDRGSVSGGEVVQEDGCVGGDGEDGVCEVVERVRERVEVEADPVAAGTGDVEGVSCFSGEDASG